MLGLRKTLEHLLLDELGILFIWCSVTILQIGSIHSIIFKYVTADKYLFKMCHYYLKIAILNLTLLDQGDVYFIKLNRLHNKCRYQLSSNVQYLSTKACCYLKTNTLLVFYKIH